MSVSFRIAIMGTGNVGGTLGRRWAEAGHTVTFGTRDPNSDAVKALLTETGDKARAALPAEAAQESSIIVLATPWAAVKDLLASLGDLTGKTIVDATNALLPKLAGLELGTTTSAAEQVASWAPGANVVKAFNTVGFNITQNPVFGKDKAVMFYCGDNAAAKEQAHSLAASLGFDPQDAGPLRQARSLEPLAFLWISLSVTPGHGRDFAFALIRR